MICIDSEINIYESSRNVVATVSLGTKLNLKEIALRARNAEYNPNRFSAVIMRIREPKTTALIFASGSRKYFSALNLLFSGKMVVTGARSEELSRQAARKFSKMMKKVMLAHSTTSQHSYMCSCCSWITLQSLKSSKYKMWWPHVTLRLLFVVIYTIH